VTITAVKHQFIVEFRANTTHVAMTKGTNRKGRGGGGKGQKMGVSFKRIQQQTDTRERNGRERISAAAFMFYVTKQNKQQQQKLDSTKPSKLFLVILFYVTLFSVRFLTKLQHTAGRYQPPVATKQNNN